MIVMDKIIVGFKKGHDININRYCYLRYNNEHYIICYTFVHPQPKNADAYVCSSLFSLDLFYDIHVSIRKEVDLLFIASFHWPHFQSFVP